MRKIIIRRTKHISPFNEPAKKLNVLNTTLEEWQKTLLAPYTDNVIEVDDPLEAPRDNVPALVVSDNLWFDEAFLKAFMAEAQKKGGPVRAAFSSRDVAYLQHGLRTLTRSYTSRGDIFYMDLWYFPTGLSEQVEPVVIPSDAVRTPYGKFPAGMPGRDRGGEFSWWVPQRMACVVDSWVHLFFINIVFGIFSQAGRLDQRKIKSAPGLAALISGKGNTAAPYVQIGQNCSIDPTAILQGPVILGDNVTIGPGCVVTQAILGDNVTLPHSNHVHMSVIGDHCAFMWGASSFFSVFMNGALIGQNSGLEFSLVGRGSMVGSGIDFSSSQLLPTSLKALLEDQLVEIDMPLLGACIGHNCRIGSGLVFYPARTVESDVVLMASATRRVIAKHISYEESDHHALLGGEAHPRLYPRMDGM
jgi:carbonic anhydrase/acetyltransferase-like protein (isoleucine patch superfamily)